MSKRRVVVSGLALALAGSTLAAVTTAAPARADVTESETGLALDLPSGVTVSGLAGEGASRAVQTTQFNDFPAKGGSYVTLSTGDATRVFQGTPDNQLSTDWGGDTQPDSSSLTLTVAQGTADAGCLFVDFALGTEEALGVDPNSYPDDGMSIVKDDVNYAVNAGRGYFAQTGWAAQPKPYEVYDLGYWHKPGDTLDPALGTIEDPRLPRITGLNNVTTRDTARVPLDVMDGADSITVTVSDAVNGDLDSVAFLDNVRLGSNCAGGTGVEPRPDTREDPNSCCGVIRGNRQVGSPLTYDPIPGTPEIEDSRTASDNGWQSPSGTPVELRFRWYRTTSSNGNNGTMSTWTVIPNADRQVYVPTAVDKGRRLIVLVTGMVDGRRAETFPSTSTASSWFVTLPIENGTFITGEAPTINPSSGMRVNDLVTAQIGSTVPRQDTYDWQWYAKTPGTNGIGNAISGQTAQTIRVPASAAGKTLSVVATARRASFDNRSFSGTAQGPVTYETWAAKGTPTIVHDGTPANGETVTVTPGEWDPVPESYSYQWKRDGAVISGASAANYTIRDADAGAALTVDVAGVKTGYAQEPRTSASITPAGKPMTGVKPTITGRAVLGERLSGGPTSYDWDPERASLTYAWYAGSALVQTGTSRTYEVDIAAIGKRITLVITARKSGYTTSSFASNPTAVVPRGTITPGSVRVSGTARVGATLRALTTSWGPRPVTLRYRWKIGSKFVGGAAGRDSSLRLPKSARGKRVTVIVTGSKAGYTTISRSAVSAKVAKN